MPLLLRLKTLLPVRSRASASGGATPERRARYAFMLAAGLLLAWMLAGIAIGGWLLLRAPACCTSVGAFVRGAPPDALDDVASARRTYEGTSAALEAATARARNADRSLRILLGETGAWLNRRSALQNRDGDVEFDARRDQIDLAHGELATRSATRQRRESEAIDARRKLDAAEDAALGLRARDRDWVAPFAGERSAMVRALQTDQLDALRLQIDAVLYAQAYMAARIDAIGQFARTNPGKPAPDAQWVPESLRPMHEAMQKPTKRAADAAAALEAQRRALDALPKVPPDSLRASRVWRPLVDALYAKGAGVACTLLGTTLCVLACGLIAARRSTRPWLARISNCVAGFAAGAALVPGLLLALHGEPALVVRLATALALSAAGVAALYHRFRGSAASV